MTFEDFLFNKHAKEYNELDDDGPDAYTEWLSNLGVNGMLEQAEEWKKIELFQTTKEAALKKDRIKKREKHSKYLKEKAILKKENKLHPYENSAAEDMIDDMSENW